MSRHATVEVDGHDGARARSNGLREGFGVERAGVRVDVGEDGRGPGVEDGERGVTGGQGRGDDFIATARSDSARCDERERERVRPRPDARRAARPAEVGPLALEGFDLASEDVSAARQHPLKRLARLGPDLFKLPSEVQKRYSHSGSSSVGGVRGRTRWCALSPRARASWDASRARTRSS